MHILGTDIRVDISSDSGQTWRYLACETSHDFGKQAASLPVVGRYVTHPQSKQTTVSTGVSLAGSLVEAKAEAVNLPEVNFWLEQKQLLKFRLYEKREGAMLVRFDARFAAFDYKAEDGLTKYTAELAVQGKAEFDIWVNLPPLAFSFDIAEDVPEETSITVAVTESNPFAVSYWQAASGQTTALNTATLLVEGGNTVAHYADIVNISGLNIDNAFATGTVTLQSGFDNLLSFSAENCAIDFEPDSWVNKTGVNINLATATPDLMQIDRNLDNLLIANNGQTIAGRTLRLSEGLEPNPANALDTDIITKIQQLEGFGWTVLPAIQQLAIRFRCDITGTVTPTVAKVGADAAWRVNNTTYTGNSPSITLVSGTFVELLVEDISTITDLNLNTCRVGGELDLSAFTHLVAFYMQDGNYPSFKFGPWIRQATTVNMYINNSVATDSNFGSLLDALIIANSGTTTDNGNDFTGDAGVTIAGRSVGIQVGTLVNQLLLSQQRINYQKWDALDDGNGSGKGFSISTVKATCRKNIDFFLTDSFTEADYKIDKDFTPLTTAPINAVDFIEGVTSYTDIAFNSAEFELLDASKVTLSPAVNNLSAIDNYLLNNDCTGFYLRCTATATAGNVGIVTLSYFDLPDDTKACGHVDTTGIEIIEWLDAKKLSTLDIDVNSKVTAFRDVMNSSNELTAAGTDCPTYDNVEEAIRFFRSQKNNLFANTYFIPDPSDITLIMYIKSLTTNLITVSNIDNSMVIYSNRLVFDVGGRSTRGEFFSVNHAADITEKNMFGFHIKSGTLYLNGVEIGSINSQNTPDFNFSGPEALGVWLRGLPRFPNYWDLFFYERMCVRGRINNSTASTIYSYLQNKHGV